MGLRVFFVSTSKAVTRNIIEVESQQEPSPYQPSYCLYSFLPFFFTFIIYLFIFINYCELQIITSNNTQYAKSNNSMNHNFYDSE